MMLAMVLVLTAGVGISSGQSIECPDDRLAVDLPTRDPHLVSQPGRLVRAVFDRHVRRRPERARSGHAAVGYRVRPAGTWRLGTFACLGLLPPRGIRAFNVTGSNTWDWMKWAAETGRGAAIGAGTAHFQTLMGYDADNGHLVRLQQQLARRESTPTTRRRSGDCIWPAASGS